MTKKMTLTPKRLVEVKGMARYMDDEGYDLTEGVCGVKIFFVKLWILGCTFMGTAFLSILCRGKYGDKNRFNWNYCGE